MSQEARPPEDSRRTPNRLGRADAPGFRPFCADRASRRGWFDRPASFRSAYGRARRLQGVRHIC